MKRYTPAQRIDYYKAKLAEVQKESEQRLEQINNLVKENTRLRCEINSLRSKINER